MLLRSTSGFLIRTWKIPEDYSKVLEAKLEVADKRRQLVAAIEKDLGKRLEILEKQARQDRGRWKEANRARTKLDRFRKEHWRDFKEHWSRFEEHWSHFEEHWRAFEEHWKLHEVVYLLLHSHWDWGAHEGLEYFVASVLSCATHRPDAAVFVKDVSERYTYVSPALASFLNVSASNLLGRRDHEVFGGEGEWRIEPVVDLKDLRGERMLCVSSLVRRVDNHNLGETISLMSLADRSEDGLTRYIGVATGPGLELMDESQVGTDGYESKAMRGVMKIVHIAARHHSTVLLTGESGSGKDYLARYIHDHSDRANGPYFPINCAQYSTNACRIRVFWS